jgi:hypothetical protein
MPVGKSSKQITAVISADDYERLRQQVAARRQSGLKETMSKYVAGAVVEKLDAEALKALFQPEPNGNENLKT